MGTKIGERIRDVRKERRMTQEELGEKVGVTKATINKYETGIVLNLKRPTIEKLAYALDISPAYLMGWTELESTPKTESKEEIELLRIFGALGVRARHALMAYAMALEEKEKDEQTKTSGNLR